MNEPVLRETLPVHLARVYPDGPPPGLIPVRLCPVEVFGADECDRCMAPAGFGLMDAVEAWSDCNRASGLIYRRDEEWMLRRDHETIIVWVTPAEAEKFERVLGDPRGPSPQPHVTRVGVGQFEVRIELTAYPVEDAAAEVFSQPAPIPNDDPQCRCRIETGGMAVLGVVPDPGCPYHGGSERAAAVPAPFAPAPGGLRELLERERGAVPDAAADALADTAVYGQGPAPADRGVRPDWDGMVQDVARVGFGRPSPVGDFPELEEQRQRILDTFGIPAQTRAQWAQVDRESMRRFLPQRSECRRYDSGTWVHRAPHTCPPYARGR